MNPAHELTETCVAEEMRYGARLDVVLEDGDGNTYYVPCIVGDCKAHTYPTGICQTGRGYPNGQDSHPENNDGSVIEFCGKASIEGLNKYKIREIIVYE